ncbi:hypothetical protein HCB18_26130 [Salinispora arenicola]|nr:hypothetical protein [Salinispora arenicola]NIL64895.1 hypothetical protein [Salinispora arenicola]
MDSSDWSSAQIDTARPHGVSIVHSTRMSYHLTERLFAEAQRRDVTPSELIREYVEAGLNTAESGNQEIVTIRVADLHRAIDTAVKRAA